jgi:PhnB protein
MKHKKNGEQGSTATTTLAEENRDLHLRVARLEQALGRATFDLFEKIPSGGVAAACPDVVAALTVSNPPDAIAWYSEVLGAREVFRVADKDGRIAHAALRIGDAVVTVNGEYPEVGKISPKNLGAKRGAHSVTLNVFVKDARATFVKALKSGSTEVAPLKKAFWGDLTGSISDPFGHRWNVSTNIEPLSAGEITRRAKEEFGQK